MRQGPRRGHGRSAGGVVDRLVNMAPRDYRVIVAQVPFVDVVPTMLDRRFR